MSIFKRSSSGIWNGRMDKFGSDENTIEKEKASSKERTIAKYLGVELPENVDENEMSIVDKLND